MLKEALAYLITMGDPMFRDEDDGRVYSSRPVVPVQKPLVEPIRVQTLTGLRDLFRLHEQTDAPAMIQIHDHTSVSMISKKVDEWLRRSVFATAQLSDTAPKFRFGQFLDPEEFIVGLMTLFEDANYGLDNRKIIKLMNNLAAEAVTTSSDDGVSQQVITKQGMVTKGEEKISPRVSLAPFRTFQDVAQPASEFILRLRTRQGQLPSCALFEADGGQWKNIAVTNIRGYFIENLPNADIIA